MMARLIWLVVAVFLFWQVVEFAVRVRRLARDRRDDDRRGRWLACAVCQRDYARRGYPSLGYVPSCPGHSAAELREVG